MGLSGAGVPPNLHAAAGRGMGRSGVAPGALGQGRHMAPVSPSPLVPGSPYRIYCWGGAPCAMAPSGLTRGVNAGGSRAATQGTERGNRAGVPWGGRGCRRAAVGPQKGRPSPSPTSALLCSPTGAPSRDVILVSAIITVSLSVTIVLCGICQWCQRRLVSGPGAGCPRGGDSGVAVPHGGPRGAGLPAGRAHYRAQFAAMPAAAFILLFRKGDN